jgi:hypothetical protein
MIFRWKMAEVTLPSPWVATCPSTAREVSVDITGGVLGMEETASPAVETAEGAENGQRAVEVSIAPADPSQSLGPLLEKALSEVVHSTTAVSGAVDMTTATFSAPERRSKRRAASADEDSLQKARQNWWRRKILRKTTVRILEILSFRFRIS